VEDLPATTEASAHSPTFVDEIAVNGTSRQPRVRHTGANRHNWQERSRIVTSGGQGVGAAAPTRFEHFLEFAR